jgi:hypothetical protein
VKLLFFIALLLMKGQLEASSCCITGSNTIITIAGTGAAGYSGDGGLATAAKLNSPYGIAIDSAGNVFFSDTYNSVVRKVDVAGNITTVAGNGIAGYSGDGGLATSAELGAPWGISLNSKGDLFIADGTCLIRKVNSSGIISTFAGIHLCGFSGDGGQATNAKIANPFGIVEDPNGNVFWCEKGNGVIRKVNQSGIISTFAGIGGNPGCTGDGGSATSAHFGGPEPIAIDLSGNFFFGEDFCFKARMINSSGIVSTFAGNGAGGFSGDGGPATSAELDDVEGIAFGCSGNTFLSVANNNRIRVVDPSGIINTIVGNGLTGFSGDGGPASAAELDEPFGIAFDGAGNLYICDGLNNRIRKVLSGCTVTDSPTTTATATITPTFTATFTPTNTPTFSATPTISPTFTVSPTLTPVPPAFDLTLYSPNPDPFGAAGVYLPYVVTDTCNVDVRIYTIAGAVVRDLAQDSNVSAGAHEEYWDGRNDSGVMANTGVFIYRITATSASGEKKEGFKKCAMLRK